ncbi:MAG: hypothetical protein AVDCRST_MAG64-863, partial [uncultured Phycisphaerae bacterium]
AARQRLPDLRRRAGGPGDRGGGAGRDGAGLGARRQCPAAVRL